MNSLQVINADIPFGQHTGLPLNGRCTVTLKNKNQLKKIMVMKPGYKSVYPVPAIRSIHRLHGYLYLLLLRKGMLGPYGLVRFRLSPNVIPHARPIRGKIGKIPLSAFPADVRLLFFKRYPFPDGTQLSVLCHSCPLVTLIHKYYPFSSYYSIQSPKTLFYNKMVTSLLFRIHMRYIL